ncbi:SDR family oxidoreductase [Kutzneria sp. 744]|uniref:SDR family oxidoreductase n=1 Tax=Kutzneria sp. (strain 744) TaxID=345341 RepID=UPI0003EEB918|nr:NAD(P)H-binding protein [Kutzneria sp. 744]EWM13284.1 NAD dependent epimerase/dehydratase [Kutzneria sp. 744]
MTVLVTGAHGRIARSLISRLTSAGTPFRVASSRPEPGEVRLDLRTGEGLAEALDGVDRVLLYTQPGGIEAFLQAAHGVRHVVQVSSSAVLYGGGSIAARHKAVEDALLSSGLPVTVLRPGAFAANSLRWAESIRARSTVEFAYPDARHAPIDEDDIAAVAQAVLGAGSHLGEALTLTGPEALSYRQQVAILAEVLDRPITVGTISRQQATERRPAFIPAEVMAELLDTDARRADEPTLVTDTVPAVTGAPARDFRRWAADHRAEFGAPQG